MPDSQQAPFRNKFRFWVFFGLAALLLLSAAAATRPGITWDEPACVGAGYGYYRWLANLSTTSLERESIDRYWAPNHEHPPAAKLLYGLAAALESRLGLSAFLIARFFAAAMFVLLVGLVCLFVALHFGRAAGLLAAAALALMPRVFGHGHLAVLDIPVSLAIFAATITFADAHAGKLRPALAGFLWGIALLTKINAVFLPVVLVPWAAWYFRKKAVLPCALFLAVGAATFFAGWPWLWHQTVARVGEYAVNKIERLSGRERRTGTTVIPVYYLGETYRDPPAPWHYPFVMTLVTVPAGLLVFAGVGVPQLVRRKRRGASDAPVDERWGSVGSLILASGLIHLVAAALPGVPKYDGVRLFMPAFPFLACLAGVGAARLWGLGRTGRAVVLAVLALDAAALAYTHPYELSYYNAAVGSAWGANKLGFETTYWGDTVNSAVIEFVNLHCPDASTVDVQPRHLGFLPGMKRTLFFAGSLREQRPTDFLVVFPRQGHLDEPVRRLLREKTPMRQWTYLGVPQCMLFDLREAKIR